MSVPIQSGVGALRSAAENAARLGELGRVGEIGLRESVDCASSLTTNLGHGIESCAAADAKSGGAAVNAKGMHDLVHALIDAADAKGMARLMNFQHRRISSTPGFDEEMNSISRTATGAANALQNAIDSGRIPAEV